MGPTNFVCAIASFALAVSTATTPLAMAQDQDLFFDPDRVFETPSYGPSSTLDRPEATAMLAFRVPLGGVARTREESRPRLSLNLGVSQTGDWQRYDRMQMHGNVFELGLNLDGDSYMNLGGEPFDYRLYTGDVESDEGGKNGTVRKVGIGVAVIAGVAVVGASAFLIAVTTSDPAE